MKLLAQVDLHIMGERVLRKANAWDSLRRRLGGEPDLRTADMKVLIDAGVLVEGMRSALGRLGATNAVSLVIDDRVLFQDREGRPDDLGELYLAFHDDVLVHGREFSSLRLAVEHEEAGVRLIIELIARSVHPEDEPAARLVVSGRLREFEPLAGESAEAYRRRVEPLTQNAATYEAHRMQFEAFVGRLSEAVRGALPESRVEIRSAEALVQRPPASPALRPAAPPPPNSPRYDPHEWYYPNPFGFLLTAMVWSSVFSMAMPPSVMLVNERGDELGTPDEVAAGGGDDDGSGDGSGPDGDGLDDGGGDFGGGDFDGGFGGD